MIEEKKDLRREYPSVVDLAYTQYKKFRKVDEIMSRDVVTVGSEVTMEGAAKVMGEKHIGSLIVIKYSTPIAIVTERDLLSRVLAEGRNPADVIVEEVMSYPLITICPKISIKEAAQTMIKNKGRLAVFECGKLVGIVTASDLIRSLPDVPEAMIKVDDFMTKKVISYDRSTFISDLVKVMGKKRIGSIIINKEEKPIGIFTERDLLTAFLSKGKTLDMPVDNHYSTPLITIPLGTSINKAATIMATKHVRRLPITQDEKIIGIITARDLVEAYAK
ncbi:MAG: CBS domain-containing protein [Nitrososphaeria archaeon]